MPAFSGLGLPHWQPAARAAILGLSAHSDRRHVARAALESIAYQLRDTLKVMRAESGVALLSLHGDGGATANALLMQFASDITGAGLRVATMPDCSPLGAALAGMLGLGVVKSLEELAAMPRSELIYKPTMASDRAQRLYAGWQRAVQQVMPQPQLERAVR